MYVCILITVYTTRQHEYMYTYSLCACLRLRAAGIWKPKKNDCDPGDQRPHGLKSAFSGVQHRNPTPPNDTVPWYQRQPDKILFSSVGGG